MPTMRAIDAGMDGRQRVRLAPCRRRMAAMKRSGYFVYGEGGTMHRDESCGEGFHHHPEVQREQWPSRRAYLVARFWQAVAHRTMPYYRPSWYPEQKRGPVDGWFRFIADRAWVRVPTVHAPLRDEDSIYVPEPES